MKAAFFDMDGTLIQEISWQKAHNFFGVNNQQNLQLFKNGKITYLEFMEKDIRLWKEESPKEATIENLEKTLCLINPRPESFSLIEKMRKKGYQKIVLVSGGIDLVAEKVAQELHLDDWFANSFEVKQRGKKRFITGPKVRFNISEKGQIIKDLAKKFDTPLKSTVAIGDSHFDTKMLEKAGTGIAFNPKNRKVKEAADEVIEDDDISKVIQYI